MDSQLREHLSRFIASKGADFVPTQIGDIVKTTGLAGVAAKRPSFLGAVAHFAVVGAVASNFFYFLALRQRKKLDEAFKIKDETFSQMLCRKIREKGMSHADCYKKAHINRRIFSKLLSDIYYKPQKRTAVAFALALELSMEEAEELLMKAGYAFSDSQLFDLILQYFIRNHTYDIDVINQILWDYDQPLLGEEQDGKLSRQKRQQQESLLIE